MTKVNGDDVVVHAGDQVITLEERLAAMQKQIKRLTWLILVVLGLVVLNAVLGPEKFWQLVNQVLGLAH